MKTSSESLMGLIERRLIEQRFKLHHKFSYNLSSAQDLALSISAHSFLIGEVQGTVSHTYGNDTVYATIGGRHIPGMMQMMHGIEDIARTVGASKIEVAPYNKAQVDAYYMLTEPNIYGGKRIPTSTTWRIDVGREKALVPLKPIINPFSTDELKQTLASHFMPNPLYDAGVSIDATWHFDPPLEHSMPNTIQFRTDFYSAAFKIRPHFRTKAQGVINFDPKNNQILFTTKDADPKYVAQLFDALEKTAEDQSEIAFRGTPEIVLAAEEPPAVSGFAFSPAGPQKWAVQSLDLKPFQ